MTNIPMGCCKATAGTLEVYAVLFRAPDLSTAKRGNSVSEIAEKLRNTSEYEPGPGDSLRGAKNKLVNATCNDIRSLTPALL